MLSIGIQPDILLCRTDRLVTTRDALEDRRSFVTSKSAAVIAKDVNSIYECPLVFAHAKAWITLALKYLHIDAKEADLDPSGEDIVRSRL